jgi:ubiquinone/menaquinone biosynthesis C-methylase UbiE
MKKKQTKSLIERKLAKLSGGRILDVATGDGGFIGKLIDAFADYDEAIGVDITDKNFEEAEKKFEKDRVSFMKADAADLHLFNDDSFDTVSIAAGLHHLPDIQAVIREMKRVLKPGGILIIREMFCDNLKEKQLSDVYLHHWSAKIDRLLGISHNSTLKKQEIIDIVENLGLTAYEAGEYNCRDCDPEKDGKMERELKDIDKDVAKVKGLPQYEELKTEGEQIRQRILINGYACATMLDVIGIK